VTTSNTVAENPQEQLKGILAIVQSGNLRAASHQLETLLSAHPNQTSGWVELGRLYRQLGDRTQSLHAFQQAEKLSPNNPTIPIDCAVELRELGEYDAADQKLRSIIAAQPNSLLAHHHLGLLYKKQQKREDSIRAFEQALSIEPTHISTNLQLAVTYKELGKTDQAKQKLRFILTQSPKHFHALLQLGALARDSENVEAALNYYQQAQQASPKRIEPPLQIAKTFSFCNRLAAAKQTLKDLLEDHPGDFRIYLELGHLGRKQGNYQEAADYFEQAQQYTKQPTQQKNVAIQRAIALRDLGQYEASAQKLNEVLTQDPTYLPALQNLGIVYQKQQKREQAIACYQKALAINPQHLPSHLQLAATWRELGNYTQAQQQLETAQQQHPQDVRILLALATLAREQQQLDRALGYCEQACNAAPDQLEPTLLLAETLRMFNRLEQAKTHLMLLLAQYPDNAKILLQLGHLERQSGQRQLALEWFQQAQQHAINQSQALSAQLFVLEELRSLNQLEVALSLAEEILQQHPDNARAKLIQAGILHTQLQLGTAEAQYQEIAEAAPHDINAQLQLATLFSETYRLTDAIALLESCYQAGHRELPLLMKLGHFARIEEDWEQAHHWFEQARQHHPHRPQVYSALSDILYVRGDVDAAMALLVDACHHLPTIPDLPLRLASLKLRFGYPTESLNILQSAYKKFPAHVPTALQLARIRLQQGDFNQVSTILTAITSDHTPWLKQIERLWGDMALWQFDLEKATQHFRQVLSTLPTTSQEHQRLALTLMLTGNIEPAHTQLTLATEALHEQKTSGKGGYPIKSHVAFLINQMRNNPQLCEELARSQTEHNPDRLLTLSAVVVQEPNYLGGSAFLCKELRQQGIFADLRNHFSSRPAHRVKEHLQIPKRIVQYWDNPSPPKDVVEVCHSWQTHNPDYQYVRFSFATAARFIKRHYDRDVLKAFQYCEHPATQADFFRLAYLNKMGGFYTDADDRCRCSLDALISSNAELIVYQEENACIGNNFLSCIPGQPIIRAAFYQAVANLLCYNNESPWMKTGPGLITTTLCSGLLPYLLHADYRAWPRLCVLSQEELRQYVWWPVSLPYKHTKQNWQQIAYQSRK